MSRTAPGVRDVGKKAKKTFNSARLIAAAVSLLALTVCTVPCRALAALKLMPPGEGVYHSAHPDFGLRDDCVSPGSVRAFEDMSGRRIVWAYLSWHWDGGVRFPVSACEAFHAEGVVPLVGIMPWSTLKQGAPEPEYTLERILNGDFDADLAQAADDARALGFPIMMEFGPEANGPWFPWSGAWNGRDADEYGEPGVPDGPERFRDSYRRIVGIFRERGAADITWIFHVASQGVPPAEWNAASYYYPGDEWADWIGASVYGRLGDGGLRPFSDIMKHLYPGLCALSPSKPLAILEMGVSEGPGKPEWITDAMRGIDEGLYPRIKAVAWWNKTRRPDGRRSMLEIDSSPESLAAYREGVRYFVQGAEWSYD